MTLSDYVASEFVTQLLGEHKEKRKYPAKRGKDLTHVPVEYRETCNDFLRSIAEKNEKTILIRKVNSKTGETKVKQIPYMHRYCEPYKNLVLAKLYYATEYLGENCPCFMLTLTTSNKGVDYEECLSQVKYAKMKLNRKLRDWGYKTKVSMLDPHKSGYSHFHVLIKGFITEDRVNKLKLFWSVNMGMGNFKNGLHVRIPNSGVSNSFFECGHMKHLASYMMKYLSKSLTSNFDDPRFLVFNATLWKTKSRFFSLSRDISKFVKEKLNWYKESLYGKKETSNWEFVSAAVGDNEGNIINEIPRRKKRPRYEYKNIYLYSLAVDKINTAVLGRINTKIYSGQYFTKTVGDMIEVYDRCIAAVY